MIITVAGHKGGIGKSVTAIHLAGYLHKTTGSVLLIDGDPNRSCLNWSNRGKLPYQVVSEKSAAKHARDFDNLVIDTRGRADEDEMAAIVEGCDLMVLPCTPDPMAIEALYLTTELLKRLSAKSYRVLLTIVPPRPSRDGDEARAVLEKAGLPVMSAQIRRAIAFQRAALFGCLVDEVDRGKIAWRDYLAVGKELMSDG